MDSQIRAKGKEFTPEQFHSPFGAGWKTQKEKSSQDDKLYHSAKFQLNQFNSDHLIKNNHWFMC